MTMITKRRDAKALCRCGRVDCQGSRPLDIPVGKEHVARAMLAADGVCRAALGSEGTDTGVVLMTALLLVERLATSLGCEPDAVLAKLSRCFELKRRYKAAPSRRN
jgi:hypothetical protein